MYNAPPSALLPPNPRTSFFEGITGEVPRWLVKSTDKTTRDARGMVTRRLGPRRLGEDACKAPQDDECHVRVGDQPKLEVRECVYILE